MQSSEKTVASYLKSLPAERAAVVAEMRSLVNKHIRSGFVESMRWGMISWEIPLSKYPKTYNKQPLSYIALAAQKNYYSLYLMSCYSTEEHGTAFEDAYRASGKKMNVGKSCVRFKKIDDLPLPLIIKYIKMYSAKGFIELYENSRK
jgi:hypothetical protein